MNPRDSEALQPRLGSAEQLAQDVIGRVVQSAELKRLAHPNMSGRGFSGTVLPSSVPLLLWKG